ncbi:pyridoxal phosphate-dependent transferase [Geopyxis carbonaria]|nr:pyridoxal phosphate-dependent transferase [Geopyxis carbonaria]
MDASQLDSFVHGHRVDLSTEKPATREYAQSLDKKDALAHFRDEFLIPSKADLRGDEGAKPNDPTDACVYLCGNSLGLQPKRLRGLLAEELDIWATRGVQGHFAHPKSRPWVSAVDSVAADMSKIVGALPSEVAVMGSLTENLHLLLASFYKPSAALGRTKIIIEAKAFPSDHYAVQSQVEWHGLAADEHMVLVQPAPGALTLTTAGICRTIDEHADTAAVLLLSGVQFYTGQLFDIKAITAHAQSKGLIVGWDLAHAVGNVPLELHEWGVDFATWCTYKYLCSSPGGMSGIFVHDRHHGRRHHLAGWWGHEPATRFQMNNNFTPAPGAAGYQLSNPSILALTALRASLSVYAETTMTAVRTKSEHITGYLEHLLHTLLTTHSSTAAPFRIITPADPRQRGAQLSLLFREGLMMPVFKKLESEGVVVDERKPDVIRVAPVPLYTRFEDVWVFVDVLRRAIEEVEAAEK